MDQTKVACVQSADDVPGGGELARHVARTNLFVVAALSSGMGSGPVHIRNMSPGGAQLEGPVVPPQGTSVRLSRGSLCVTGEIVWQRETRGGVRFHAGINIPDWLPAGIRVAQQQRVDKIVHSHKTYAAAAFASSAASQPAVGFRVFAADLVAIAAALAEAADELAGEAATLSRHPRALQILDSTAQQVDNLAARLRSSVQRSGSP